MQTTAALANPGLLSELTTGLPGLAGPNETTADYSEILKRERYESYTLYHVTVAMSTYYQWIILAIGLPGNLASIFTILTMKTVSSSKAHVAILAFIDALGIILKVTYSELSYHRVHLTSVGCTFIMFIQQFCTTYVNWIVVAMTVERCVAVCFPLRVGRIYTKQKALIVLAILAVITEVLFLPFFWFWTEEQEDGYGYWCALREQYLGFVYGAFYWMEASYSTIIPCLIIQIGNLLIIFMIRMARKAQRQLTNSFDQGGRKARDQRQITCMLLVVSLVFLLLNMPNAIFYLVKGHWKPAPYSYEMAEKEFTARFIHILTDSNHAINFFLYFFSMPSFRRRFLDAVRCRPPDRRRPGVSGYRTSQTYIHSGHASEVSRTDGGRYGISSIPMKKNSSNLGSHHSLKSCSSTITTVANPRIGGNHNTDASSPVTANSEL